MTEKRNMEIKETAESIIAAASDLQLVAMHHPKLGKESEESQAIYMKLKSIKNMAGTLMRRDEREESETMTPVKIQMVNGWNSLGMMMKTNVLYGGLSGKSSGQLMKMRNMAAVVVDRTDAYLATKTKAESNTDNEAA